MLKDEFFVITNFDDADIVKNSMLQKMLGEARKYNVSHGLPWTPAIEWVWDKLNCPHCRGSLFEIGTLSMFFFNEYCAVIYYPLCVKCTKKLIKYQHTDHREGEFSMQTENNLIPSFLEWNKRANNKENP
jgi:hypothetical protein